MADLPDRLIKLQSSGGAPIVAGIVAEYNPFHSGHHWMIRMLKRGGVDTVVCVLSGPYVQRAEPALLPTHLRARAALACGADLVLRLPAPWATASAEAFSQGAVGILAALGCVDILAFGAENDDVDTLSEIAELLLVEGFASMVKAELASGQSFAAARSAAAERIIPGAGAVLRTPNNILGIEYVKALKGPLLDALRKRLPAGTFAFALPVPLAMPRVGAAHDGAPAEGFASASWLRALARKEGMVALTPWVPEASVPIYLRAEADGEMTDPNRWEAALLSRLRGLQPLDFALHTGAGEGLESRMAEAAKQATTLAGLYDAAKTKRFAHSRVRRLALTTALNLPHPGVLPPFIQVLAASGKGLRLLKKAKEKALLPVSTSLAKLARTGAEAELVARHEAAAEDLYALCQQKPAAGGGAYTRPATIQAGRPAGTDEGGE